MESSGQLSLQVQFQVLSVLRNLHLQGALYDLQVKEQRSHVDAEQRQHPTPTDCIPD